MANTFMNPLKPSPALAAIVGPEPLARTEATKRAWAYIKERSLQNPDDKRRINCDDALKAVCGGAKVITMFELTKHLGRNLTK